MLMKYLVVSLMLLLLPIMNAHRLLGSLISEGNELVPIENHLSDSSLRILETVVDNVEAKHCQRSNCEKGMRGYLNHILDFIAGI
jgi:hypothetical protein